MRTLFIESNSEGEQYFISEYLPICKDEVVCRLGEIFGVHWNEYDITDDDFARCRIHALSKQRNARV